MEEKKRKKYNVHNRRKALYVLTKEQKEAVKMLVRGEKMHVVAQKLGVHRATIWRWLQRPAVIAYKRDEEGRQELREVERHIKLMNSEDLAKRQAACVWILDKAGVRL